MELPPSIVRLHVLRVISKTGLPGDFFNNFLALVIKAKVADADSDGATAYSVGLIIVNIFIFLSIWGNTFATIKATFSRSHVQVCPLLNISPTCRRVQSTCFGIRIDCESMVFMPPPILIYWRIFLWV